MRQQLVYISELSKSFDVPIAPGVNMELLKKNDPNPQFVTMEVAKVGTKSGNGLHYDEALVNRIYEQIQSERPIGIFGHLSAKEMHTYPTGEVQWLGAQKIGNTLYAKAYLISEAAKSYFNRAAATGMKVATSIFGNGVQRPAQGGGYTLSEFFLDQIDIVPHTRAAAPMSGQFQLTAEMLQFGYASAVIRVPLKNDGDGAAAMTSLHAAMNAARTQLGTDATISVQLEESHSADEEAAATVETLRQQLAAAQQQIRELSAPVQLPLATRQLATDFDDYTRTKIIREYNTSKNPQQMIADYPMLFLDAKTLVTVNKQLLAELQKPRTASSTFGQIAPVVPQQTRERYQTDEWIAETKRKFEQGYTPPTQPAPDQTTIDAQIREYRQKYGVEAADKEAKDNSHYAEQDIHVVETLRKFGWAEERIRETWGKDKSPEQIAAARRRTGI